MVGRKHLYILIFTIFVLIGIQFTIHKIILNAKNNVQFIDIVERQKTLVDKINIIVSRLYRSEDLKEVEINYEELIKAKDMWQSSQKNIKYGNSTLNLEINNSKEMISFFAKTEKPFQEILKEINAIEKENQKTITDKSFLIPIQKTIEENKIKYLEHTQEIITQHEKETSEFIKNLEFIETVVLFMAFAVLLIEWKIVFKPIEKKDSKQVLSNQ